MGEQVFCCPGSSLPTLGRSLTDWLTDTLEFQMRWLWPWPLQPHWPPWPSPKKSVQICDFLHSFFQSTDDQLSNLLRPHLPSNLFQASRPPFKYRRLNIWVFRAKALQTNRYIEQSRDAWTFDDEGRCKKSQSMVFFFCCCCYNI